MNSPCYCHLDSAGISQWWGRALGRGQDKPASEVILNSDYYWTDIPLICLSCSNPGSRTSRTGYCHVPQNAVCILTLGLKCYTYPDIKVAIQYISRYGGHSAIHMLISNQEQQKVNKSLWSWTNPHTIHYKQRKGERVNPLFWMHLEQLFVNTNRQVSWKLI